MTENSGPHGGHNHSHNDFQPDIKEPTENWEFLEIALRAVSYTHLRAHETS